MANFIVTKSFKKSAKVLDKRYKSFKEDLASFMDIYEELPAFDLGGGLKKIRMIIGSKGKGKSGGARVISYDLLTYNKDKDVVLLYIYDKEDMDNVSMDFLKQLKKEYL